MQREIDHSLSDSSAPDLKREFADLFALHLRTPGVCEKMTDRGGPVGHIVWRRGRSAGADGLPSGACSRPASGSWESSQGVPSVASSRAASGSWKSSQGSLRQGSGGSTPQCRGRSRLPSHPPLGKNYEAPVAESVACKHLWCNAKGWTFPVLDSHKNRGVRRSSRRRRLRTTRSHSQGRVHGDVGASSDEQELFLPKGPRRRRARTLQARRSSAQSESGDDSRSAWGVPHGSIEHLRIRSTSESEKEHRVAWRGMAGIAKGVAGCWESRPETPARSPLPCVVPVASHPRLSSRAVPIASSEAMPTQTTLDLPHRLWRVDAASESSHGSTSARKSHTLWDSCSSVINSDYGSITTPSSKGTSSSSSTGSSCSSGSSTNPTNSNNSTNRKGAAGVFPVNA